MSQLQMWAFNVYGLLGGLLALGAVAVLLVVVWTGVKVLIWQIQQRRAMREYLARTRRRDGHRYPPVGGGICDHCGRVSKKVYWPAEGPRLCAPCYEAFWPQARSEPAEPGLTADLPAEPTQVPLGAGQGGRTWKGRPG